MGRYKKLIANILRGTADSNISFIQMCQLLKKLGFDYRVKGDHHIFFKNDVEEIINLQPSNAKVKPYQVKQVRQLILKYKLGGQFDA